jgi:5,10-methylenetetrahydromethanopterin reductase
MKIAVRVPPCAPVPKLVELARRMESGGIDGVSFPDSQLLWRDVWSTLTACAMGTSTLELAVNVTNPVTRHPTVTAGAARTVGELAPGRFRLGIGVGDSSVTHIGHNKATGAELSKYVTAVRTLLRGDEVPDDVYPWKLIEPFEVPVLIAASGPKNLAIAGRVANGAVIPGVFWDRGLSIVRDAALAAGREPDALQHTMMRTCIITDDPVRDVAIFKVSCLRHAQMGGTAIFEEAGLPITVPSHDLGIGQDLGHPKDWDAAIQFAAKYVPDETGLWYARSRALFGTPEEVAGQLTEIAATGVERLMLAQMESFKLPEGLVDSLINEVLPRVRQVLPGAGLASNAAESQ